MRLIAALLVGGAFVAVIVIPIGILTRPNGVWFFGRNKP